MRRTRRDRLPGARTGTRAAGRTAPTPSYFAADGFLAGRRDRHHRPRRLRRLQSRLCRPDVAARRADATVSYRRARHHDRSAAARDRQSIYVGAETAANIQLNAGVTIGLYRPRGAAPGAWADVLNDDRFVSGRRPSTRVPPGQFGYGAQYLMGSRRRAELRQPRAEPLAGAQLRTSRSPTASSAPPTIRCAHQHVVSGTWQITGAQALAARWVDDDGGYYRLSYRRSARPQRRCVRRLHLRPQRALANST